MTTDKDVVKRGLYEEDKEEIERRKDNIKKKKSRQYTGTISFEVSIVELDKTQKELVNNYFGDIELW